MADTSIQRPRETWFVTNVSNVDVRITDIPTIPIIKPGQRIDLLVYTSLSKAQSSQVITGYISASKLTTEEYLHTHDDKSNTGHKHVLTDITDVTASTEDITKMTDGSNVDDLHKHEHNLLEGLNKNDYIHLTASDKVDFTTLTDGSNADDLHTHDGAGGISTHNELDGLNDGDYIHLTSAEKTNSDLNTSKRHEEIHTIASHDTTATGSELNILTDGTNADSLHIHGASGITGLTSQQILYGSVSTTIAQSSLLTWDGTTLEVAGNTWLASNSSKLFLGDSQQSSIYFDGTNLNIDLDDPSSGGVINLNDSVDVIGALRVGDGGVTNYSEFEYDGNLTFHGDATVWDDIQTSLIGRRLSSTSGGVGYNYAENTITFSPNGDETDINKSVGFNIQLSHKTKVDSILRLHVHFEQPDSSTYEFTAEYRIQNNGSLKTTGWTTISADSSSDNTFPYVSGTLNQIISFENIDLTGFGLSSVVQIHLARTDAVGGDIEVTFADCHFKIDTIGSRLEFAK